jgi:predicted RNase H-like HicB family nuclease
MTHYPALIRKETDSDFGVEFPDFPGCVTAGSTLEEAIRQAEEVLRLHVEGMVAEGEVIAAPTPLDAILKTADARGAAAILVPLRRTKARAVRVNITLDEFLLLDIDAEAARRGLTRSAFLAEAARVSLPNVPVLSRIAPMVSAENKEPARHQPSFVEAKD